MTAVQRCPRCDLDDLREAVAHIWRAWLDKPEGAHVAPEHADWSYDLGGSIVAAAMTAGCYEETRKP